jgi:AhpD family alkylhydroperoxidase
MVALALVVAPPERIPLLIRPAVWLAERITGKEALPARLLTRFVKGAVGAGVMEALAASGADMDQLDGARVLAVARIVASAVAGCPFCVDMNAATWKRAGITPEELRALLEHQEARIAEMDGRAAIAARYARALSMTPVAMDDALAAELRARFSEREIVVLATTIAQVNFWSRFNQGLGVPAAGFFDESACALP